MQTESATDGNYEGVVADLAGAGEFSKRKSEPLVGNRDVSGAEDRQGEGSLNVSIPGALLWLSLALGAVVLAGTLIGKASWIAQALPKEFLWAPIAAAFYALWKGRSHAALMLRMILLLAFTVIIVAAAVWSLLWVSSETAPLLVVFLCAIGMMNFVFYYRWVRLAALGFNLE